MSLVVSGKSLTSTCSGLTMVAGNTTILWDLGQFYGTWASFRVMGLGPISFMGLGHATPFNIVQEEQYLTRFCQSIVSSNCLVYTVGVQCIQLIVSNKGYESVLLKLQLTILASLT